MPENFIKGIEAELDVLINLEKNDRLDCTGEMISSQKPSLYTTTLRTINPRTLNRLCSCDRVVRLINDAADILNVLLRSKHLYIYEGRDHDSADDIKFVERKLKKFDTQFAACVSLAGKLRASIGGLDSMMETYSGETKIQFELTTQREELLERLEKYDKKIDRILESKEAYEGVDRRPRRRT